MKFTTVAFLSLGSLAIAAPTDSKLSLVGKDNWGKNKDRDCKPQIHKDSFPFDFTSTAVAYASPGTIVNNSQVAVPGLEGGWGKFAFGLNSKQDVICYNITVWIKGNYSSPAVTATHIHQAPVGRAGPPRLAFPNPIPINGGPPDQFSWRRSVGCLSGPFKTGVVTNGSDTAANFTIAALEKDLSGFFADTHTVEFPAGAIRGQLQWY